MNDKSSPRSLILQKTSVKATKVSQEPKPFFFCKIKGKILLAKSFQAEVSNFNLFSFFIFTYPQKPLLCIIFSRKSSFRSYRCAKPPLSLKFSYIFFSRKHVQTAQFQKKSALNYKFYIHNAFDWELDNKVELKP